MPTDIWLVLSAIPTVYQIEKEWLIAYFWESNPPTSIENGRAVMEFTSVFCCTSWMGNICSGIWFRTLRVIQVAFKEYVGFLPEMLVGVVVFLPEPVTQDNDRTVPVDCKPIRKENHTFGHCYPSTGGYTVASPQVSVWFNPCAAWFNWLNPFASSLHTLKTCQ